MDHEILFCAKTGRQISSDPEGNVIYLASSCWSQPVMATETVIPFPFPPMPASNVVQFPRRPVMGLDNNDDVGRFAQDMTIRARPGITLAVIDEAERLEREALKQRIADEEWRRIAAEEDLI